MSTTAPRLVTDHGEADAVLARCRLAGFLAMDTEFMRTDTFYAVPALYQVNDGQQTALLDPLALDGVQGLADLLDDPELPVVMHGCSEDVDLVARQLGARLTRLFDTQLAVAFCGGPYSQSYRGLVQDEFDVEVDKEATRSDWLRRPLSDQQLHYAAQDVAWLPELYQRLRQRLGSRAAWHAEECSHLVADVLDGPGPDDWYRNIKGAWRLDRRETAALQQLTALRERAARDRDRPRSRVLKDEDLLAIVEQEPANLDGLRALLHPGQVRRDGEAILDILEDVRRLPQAELPERLPQPFGRRTGELLKALRKAARAIADDLGVAEELVARKRLLEDLLRVAAEQGGVADPDDEDLLAALPARFLGWRLEPVTRPLLLRIRESGFAAEWAA